MKTLSTIPATVASRYRYHHEEHYRQMCIRSTRLWQGRNREFVNGCARVAYDNRPEKQKLERLATIKLKRKLGYWKNH